MDRKAWIAIILSIAGLVGWQWYYVKTYGNKPATRSAAASATPAPGTPAASGSPATAGTPNPASLTAAPTPSTPSAPVMKPASESLYSQSTEYVFANDKGGIERAMLLLHGAENKTQVALNGSQTLPIGAIGQTPGEAWGGFTMKTEPARGEAIFTKTDSDGLEITKRFILPYAGADPYLARMELTFKNTGANELKREGYFVSTGGAAPIHQNDLPMYTKFDWNGAGKFHTIDVNWFNAGGLPFLGIQWSAQKDLYLESKPDVIWAGVASQYFATLVTSEKTKGNSVWAKRFDTEKGGKHAFGMQGGLGMPGFTLQPGEAVTETFAIYTGPKDLKELRKMKGTQDAVMNFGMFGIISELLLWAMNGLYGIFHSFAAAIIVLTLIIKTLLWPVQNKATNEMRKMAALSPKMTEMREKFKDDPQKLNEEMMKLYREYGVNPFSGCLPMLIQIPIFFGFYAMLGSAIELRNSSFFWIQDLSQPDTIGHIPYLNFPINLLPIIMAGTMVWQMAISPKSGDAVQQRMFYFMPVIFLVFCYNYASGLALYWTTQNLFSIVQLYLTRNKPLPTLEKKSVIAKRQADAARKKKKRI
jgi:YidC/Oxa1 family membrane protein insertase